MTVDNIVCSNGRRFKLCGRRAVEGGGGGLAHNSCTEFSKLTLHVYRREDFK